MKANKILLLCLLFIALSSCNQKTQAIKVSENNQKLNDTQSVSTSTVLPTPTGTPTPEIPVHIGTPIPFSDAPLSKDTINHIQEVGYVQNGHLLTRATSNLNEMFIADRSGVTLCKMEILEDLSRVVPCQDVINNWDIDIRINNDQSLNTDDFVITPTGSHFLIVTNTNIQIYDHEGVIQGELLIPDNNFTSALSPDGSFASITSNETVNVYKVMDGEIVFTTDGFESKFTSDGKFLAAQKRMAVYLYSTEDWSLIYTFPQDRDSDWAISGNANLIANYVGKDLVIHNLSDGEYSHTVQNISSDQFGTGDIIISPSGKTAIQVFKTIKNNNYRTTYDDWFTFVPEEECFEYQIKKSYYNIGVEEGEVDSKWYVSGDYMSSINTATTNNLIDKDENIYFIHLERPWKYLATGQRFYNFEDGTIVLFSIYTDEPYPHPNEVCKIDPSLEVTCETTYYSFLLDAGLITDSTGHIYTTFRDNDYLHLLLQAEFIPQASDIDTLISAYKKIEVPKEIDMSSYQLKAVNNEKNFFIGHYKYYDDVIDMGTGEKLLDWKGDISYAIQSSDSNFIAFIYKKSYTNDPMRLGIYDYANNAWILFQNEYRPSSYVFTNDSEQLVSIINESTQNGVDKIVAYPLYEEEKEAIVIAEYAYQENPDVGRLNTIALSPDGGLILAGTDKGYILGFDKATGELIYQWQADSDAAILAVTFTKDGKTIYTSSEYGDIKIWASQPFDWNVE